MSRPFDSAGDEGGHGWIPGPTKATSSEILPCTLDDHMRTQPTSMVRGVVGHTVAVRVKKTVMGKIGLQV
jgi:hypothetical protein